MSVEHFARLGRAMGISDAHLFQARIRCSCTDDAAPLAMSEFLTLLRHVFADWDRWQRNTSTFDFIDAQPTKACSII